MVANKTSKSRKLRNIWAITASLACVGAVIVSVAAGMSTSVTKKSKLVCLGNFKTSTDAYNAIDDYLDKNVSLQDFYHNYMGLDNAAYLNDVYIGYADDYSYTYGIMEVVYNFELKDITDPLFEANIVNYSQDTIVYRLEGDPFMPGLSEIAQGDWMTLEHHDYYDFFALTGYLSSEPFNKDWDQNLASYEVGVDGYLPLANLHNFYDYSNYLNDLIDGVFDGTEKDFWDKVTADDRYKSHSREVASDVISTNLYVNLPIYNILSTSVADPVRPVVVW